ncbi:hypothetical protein [Ancylobacter vacuolatus]|uniref:Replication protein n=1 Tax=Ancylobacter vacuolatus TaxID=223389 RepID=A0ABU0DM61_9HYPH|nr:hypothetical protein [Ancylobacter vacuolatus]MDQ0349406.1 hypothetical protein [Ancylobacter vacuolatus]
MTTSIKPKQTKSWTFPTLKAFRDRHLKVALELDRYLHFPRKGKQTLDFFQLRGLKKESSPYWLASNVHSRIAFMEIVERRFRKFLRSKPASKMPMAMVTLLSKEFVIPITEAETYDTSELASWTRRTLAGFNYIGMVEAALIGNVRLSAEGKPEWVVHFHTHCLVWDFDRKELANREIEINRAFESWRPGITVMKVTPTSPENCLKRLRYIFKGQLTGHKISPKRAWEAAGRSGVPVRRETGFFTFYSYPLRPAEMVRMVRVMANRTLDKLMLAGGPEGNALYTEIRREALLKVPRRHREEEGQLFLDRTYPDDEDAA